ncbi:MAG: HAMP domain-containing protein, partial [Candidatus Nealsonbacteria bacterium]|nr:HAMP domain-containing protein [Candidatus Nealsonbacteria bacterium]
MKFKPNLQFKLLVVVSLVIVLTLSFFYYLSVNSQKKIFHDSFRDSAISLARALDAGIGSKDELNDVAKLQSNIYKTIWLSSNIVGISISLPVKTGLEIVASNDTGEIGKTAIPESLAAYQDGTISTKVMTEVDGTEALRVITPVHVGGQRVGIYSIKLSLDPLEKVITKTQREFSLITLMSILAIIGSLSFSIKITVIDPIKELLSGMEKIGGGELDYRVKTKRQDEIGDLFSSLNVMAEKLKDRTEALQTEREGLAEKVTQKTKELQEKIKDLEKFNKIVVG